jgi:hypothetical protein
VERARNIFHHNMSDSRISRLNEACNHAVVAAQALREAQEEEEHVKEEDEEMGE